MLRFLLLLSILLFSTSYKVPEGLFLLEKAKEISIFSLDSLVDRWNITNYPLFLKSCYSSRKSLDIFNYKFQKKIISSLLSAFCTGDSSSTLSKTKFVISFMGSSVTAGHDSSPNSSLVSHTFRILSPLFNVLNITFETRNVAMGNNPCVPYDLCMKTFAGSDADIVHWEQSYNCFNSKYEDIFEQFVRQALYLSDRPIIVFSESQTPNWKEKICEGIMPDHALSAREKPLVHAMNHDPLSLMTDHNHRELQAWPYLHQILNHYTHVPIQLFRHHHYEGYKCQGPYIRNWGCCSASWHPSLKGHELRAAHFSYFWLLSIREAIADLLKQFNEDTKLDKESEMCPILHKRHSLTQFQYHQLISPSNSDPSVLYPSHLVDNMTCLTDYEPRSETFFSLKSHVVSWGFNESFQWSFNIIDALKNPRAVSRHRSLGYQDFRHVLIGNNGSGPLSLSINIRQPGSLVLCQPPGDWGKIPQGMVSLWEDNAVSVYLSPWNTKTPFVFVNSMAMLLKFTNPRPKDSQSVCMHTVDKIPLGNHVLSIIPASKSNIAIGVVLIP